MPLELLLVLVVAGIAGIALILHLAGLSQRATLTAKAARSGWLRQFPDDQITGIVLASGGHSALIRTGDGPGLVWALGADTVARRLRDIEIQDRPTGLRICFHDITAPAAIVRLTDTERQDWRRQLEIP